MEYVIDRFQYAHEIFGAAEKWLPYWAPKTIC